MWQAGLDRAKQQVVTDHHIELESGRHSIDRGAAQVTFSTEAARDK